MTITSAKGDPLTAALNSSQPFWRLREVAREMLTSGMEGSAVLEQLEALRQSVRNGPHPEQEDVVLDVMDVLEDWVPPHLRL